MRSEQLSARAPVRRSLLRHALLVVIGFVMLYPLLWLLMSSFKSPDQIFSNPSLWPDVFSLDGYFNGWNALSQPFSTYIVNSLIVTLLSVVGNLVTCSMAAYAFARLRFSFRRAAFVIMLATLMLPMQVVIVPQYVLFSELGMVGSFLPLVLPKFLAVDSFFIFLMVQFIRSLPRELDEAAVIDGCNRWTIYWRIIMPLTLPALATTAIFTFIWTWNDFFSQLVYLSDPTMHTVPVALRAYLDSTGVSQWDGLLAMSVLSLLPVVVIFFVGQRYLVRGIATTGLK